MRTEITSKQTLEKMTKRRRKGLFVKSLERYSNLFWEN